MTTKDLVTLRDNLGRWIREVDLDSPISRQMGAIRLMILSTVMIELDSRTDIG